MRQHERTSECRQSGNRRAQGKRLHGSVTGPRTTGRPGRSPPSKASQACRGRRTRTCRSRRCRRGARHRSVSPGATAASRWIGMFSVTPCWRNAVPAMAETSGPPPAAARWTTIHASDETSACAIITTSPMRGGSARVRARRAGHVVRAAGDGKNGGFQGFSTGLAIEVFEVLDERFHLGDLAALRQNNLISQPRGRGGPRSWPARSSGWQSSGAGSSPSSKRRHGPSPGSVQRRGHRQRGARCQQRW